MKQWKLLYEFSSEFTAPATGHYFKLRCFPRECTVQKCSSLRWSVRPAASCSFETDPFGNRLLFGCCEEAHERFDIGLNAVVLKGAEPEAEPKAYYRLGMLRTPTILTAMGPALTGFYGTVENKENTAPWERAGELMAALFDAFSYESQSTDFTTTAEEAFSQGRGVCQDYAHIMLALCRRSGLTVRYVAGTIPGEGETHAWIEVWQDGFWKGFDPTHNREADDGYISFTVGRDAFDCEINRGIFKDSFEKNQQVYVRMEEF